MKTFTAREPDHRAMAKPMEMMSGRAPVVTSASSGLAKSLTPRSESTVCEAERMLRSMEATVVVVVHSST
ncbi:hypothetical protein Smic_66970 [Streptomyces microflavus]|uniref:Uncharacterized protein n=1 Tax=Streptomyces microflavus TaxID=1919 RepID=A0A7J0D073_STRMI|nr:hypothetical protein Smic_66970 [Streptomyces microflavus]